jgi:hypothetical protein
MIAVEWVLVLIAFAGMVAVVAWALGWGRPAKPASHVPSVRLVRTARTAEGREELLLTVNERVILAAGSEGLRLAEYAEQTERMEAVATRLATALGAPVEFARAPARKPGEETGFPMAEAPYVSDEELAHIEARREAAGKS